MTIFACFATDVPNGVEVRARNKSDHVKYISRDVSLLRLAGALVDKDGAQCGTLYLIEAESEDDVRAWFAAEPYARGGTYETLVIRQITLNPPWGVPNALPADGLARILSSNG